MPAMKMSELEIGRLSEELHQARLRRRAIEPLTNRFADLSTDDAYRISLRTLARRQTDGEQVIGKKIGLTSEAVQRMLAVDQPDFGFLTDAMWARDGVVEVGNLIAPRAEAEIAFKLRDELVGPGVTPEEVLAATASVVVCFEIVDSRIRDWKIRLADTIADNASCGLFVLGPAQISPAGLNLARLEAVVEKNGRPLSTGFGAAVQGAPENAVAWLANTLGAYGIPLRAGEIILSGSLVPLEPVVAGDRMRAVIDGLGECVVAFE